MEAKIRIEDAKEFEKALIQICDSAFAYGVNNVGYILPEKDGEEKYKEFIGACHKGYALAQKEIINRLIPIEQKLRSYSSELRTAKQSKKSGDIKRIEIQIEALSYMRLLLRKIGDALGWMIMGMEPWKIRRFYAGKKMGYLDGSNIESTMQIVEQINREPLKFGLICDITTCFQVCDVIEIDASNIRKPKISFVEIKEGKMNEKVMDMLKEYSITKCDRALYFFGRVYGTDAIKQLFRVARQQLRVAEAQRILKTGKGRDILTGKELNIEDKYYIEEDYYEVFDEIIKMCRSEGNSIVCIDDCLYIGMFARDKFPYSYLDFQHAIYHLLNPGEECPIEEGNKPEEELKRVMAQKYRVSDLRMGFRVPLARPLYLWPIDKDIMMDIIFGRKVVFSYLDFDRLFKVASVMGFETGWTKIRPGITDYFTRMGKRPFFKKEGTTIEMGDVTLGKIQFDGVRPSSVLKIWNESVNSYARRGRNRKQQQK